MTVRDVQSHLREIYDVDVSADLISRVDRRGVDGVPAMDLYAITHIRDRDRQSAWPPERNQSIRDVPFSLSGLKCDIAHIS